MFKVTNTMKVKSSIRITDLNFSIPADAKNYDITKFFDAEELNNSVGLRKAIEKGWITAEKDTESTKSLSKNPPLKIAQTKVKVIDSIIPSIKNPEEEVDDLEALAAKYIEEKEIAESDKSKVEVKVEASEKKEVEVKLEVEVIPEAPVEIKSSKLSLEEVKNLSWNKLRTYAKTLKVEVLRRKKEDILDEIEKLYQ